MKATDLITVKHAAARLDASPMTVYRLIYAKKLKPHRIGLGQTKPRIRVAVADLDAYIASTAA